MFSLPICYNCFFRKEIKKRIQNTEENLEVAKILNKVAKLQRYNGNHEESLKIYRKLLGKHIREFIGSYKLCIIFFPLVLFC